MGFIERGHLGFGAAFVQVREFGLISAGGGGVSRG